MLEIARGTLLQEGYRPGPLQGQTLSFRYYGQSAQLRIQPLGPGAALGEVECLLPHPAPSSAQMLAFSATHPLSRLGAQDGRAALLLSTMLTEGDAGRQVQALLGLLDQYAADAAFGEGAAGPADPPEPSGSAVGAEPASTPTRAAGSVPEGRSAPERGSESAPSDPSPAPPHGWQELWELMNPRFHPLAHALAALGVPAPDDVHVDMVQGHQVHGAAIMMWGLPPGAVVVCEPGQPVPGGYQGSTWYKHLTVERVAQETRAHLQAAGRL